MNTLVKSERFFFVVDFCFTAIDVKLKQFCF